MEVKLHRGCLRRQPADVCEMDRLRAGCAEGGAMGGELAVTRYAKGRKAERGGAAHTISPQSRVGTSFHLSIRRSERLCSVVARWTR